jgi:xylulose-5-phosphate/fructose-6-phosphate phosphoketolase
MHHDQSQAHLVNHASAALDSHSTSDDRFKNLDAYWRAANYVSVGQIFLWDNPLLKLPLTLAHVKPMLLGHWGTTPGQNFIYVHLNRIIKAYDLDMLYICGPGHGGPAVVGNTYLEGSYSEVYPHITRDEAGLKQLFTQFSFPGGIPSHASPECPGSIHEGGELGYSLSHAFGAVFDNPDLVVACVVGDGEAETGPLATSWHSNKFLNAANDGAVLPILHLNGYKIASPSVLARISHEELEQLLRGYGWSPLFVEGDEPMAMHALMAQALDDAVQDIRHIQSQARAHGRTARPRWPMIVLKSPKGWTGPEDVDGEPIEGNFRAHQVPLHPARHPHHLGLLEDWLRSYKPHELFDERGALMSHLAALAPTGNKRMGASPHANGGALLRDLIMPDYRAYAAHVPEPGAPGIGDAHVLGPFLRDVTRLNDEARNFRVFGPDETASNGLEAVFEVTDRQWEATTATGDQWLAPTGRVLEMLSEHQCEGWLEGYLLTGRHGVFNCYEAFVHIIDSMFNQHAKWLKVSGELAWRQDIASLNYLLASHVWRQDHNGFSHQDPGFLDLVVNKKAEVVRVYLPPDANCLLSVMDHCLRSRQYVNVVVAGKHPAPQWLDIQAAQAHCAAGIGIWAWAGNEVVVDDVDEVEGRGVTARAQDAADQTGASADAAPPTQGSQPDVVMACCGDVPTLETMAAVRILRQELPELRVRVVNVVDLMRLQPELEHPHGLSDAAFDALFTRDKPVIFAFHAYPWLIHRLTYRRTNHANLHVRGYKEEGTITTPFDMTVLNDLDRFHLVIDAIDRLPHTGAIGQQLEHKMLAKLDEHHSYIRRHGQDMPEIRNWRWSTAPST